MAGVQLTGVITPKNPDLDTYPVFDDKYGKGGYRVVETIEERDNITDLRRKWGMLAYVLEEEKTYQLLDQGNGDITNNVNWVEFEVTGGGASKGYSTTFTQNNLSSGMLTINHNLNAVNRVCNVTIMDDTSNKVEPDAILFLSKNILKVDLRQAEPINGTWSIVVITVPADDNSDETQDNTSNKSVFNQSYFNQSYFN